jgi:hypothetical protein
LSSFHFQPPPREEQHRSPRNSKNLSRSLSRMEEDALPLLVRSLVLSLLFCLSFFLVTDSDPIGGCELVIFPHFC